MGLTALMVLTGCSDSDSDRQESVRVAIAAYVAPYTYVEAASRATRTDGWWPSDYKPYNDLANAGYVMKSNERAAIGVFFTSGATSIDLRRFRMNSTGDFWLIDEEVPGGDYLLYGFVPYGAVNLTTTAIEPVENVYANGAVLHLNGLNGVMNQDVCVIVGAKHGTKTGDNDPVPVSEVKPGDFACSIINSVEPNNYVFLLFDHLYAAMHFRFRVGDKYDALRTIKLKKIELTACSDEACEHPERRKVNTTVTLLTNTDGSSPIDGDITFTADNTSDPMEPVTISDLTSSPVTLQTGDHWTDHVGFVTRANSFYLLRTTYDVYDKNGNLIRKNCVAENKINPLKYFETRTLERGYMYSLKLTVEPTYLYVLSEPDLNSPTVKIED